MYSKGVLQYLNHDSIGFDPIFDDAIVGSTNERKAVYDYYLMLGCLVAHNRARDDAREQLFELIYSELPHMGDKRPVVLFLDGTGMINKELSQSSNEDIMRLAKIFDDAIIGETSDDRVVYEYTTMAACLVDKGISEDDAYDLAGSTIYSMSRCMDHRCPVVIFIGYKPFHYNPSVPRRRVKKVKAK